MSTIPDDLRYSSDHEWARPDGDLYVIGITHHAQDQLGDVVYVELPEAGAAVEKGKPFGSIESTKAVNELFAPISGTVEEVNEGLLDAPEAVNEDPYGSGWMIRLRAADPAEYEGLLDAAAYATLIEQA